MGITTLRRFKKENITTLNDVTPKKKVEKEQVKEVKKKPRKKA